MSKLICVFVLFNGLMMPLYSADTTDWKYAYHKESMIYYVSPSGSDENPGTMKEPFRTMQKAAEIMLTGDVCYVSEGVYRETVRPVYGGMMGRPIRFQAYPGEVATLSGTEPIKGGVLEFTPDNWMVARELTVSVNKKLKASDRAIITFSGEELKDVRVPVRIISQ